MDTTDTTEVEYELAQELRHYAYPEGTFPEGTPVRIVEWHGTYPEAIAERVGRHATIELPNGTTVQWQVVGGSVATPMVREVTRTTDFAAFSDDRLAEALEAAQVAIVDAIRDKDADRVGYYDDSITAIVAEQDRRTDRRPLAGAAKTEVDSFLATITGFASFPAYVNIGPDGTAVYWGSVFIARLPVAGTSQQGRGRSGGQVATFGDLRAEVEAYIANGLRFTDHPHGGTGR